MIQHCKKNNIFIYIHGLTKTAYIQIQKALWRKLEPLFSRNKILDASETEVTEYALALEGNPSDQIQKAQ